MRNCLTTLGVLYSVLGPVLYKGTLNIHEKANEVVLKLHMQKDV